MTADPPGDPRATLVTRARQFSERAGAALAGLFPGATDAPAQEPALDPVALPPRVLARGLSRRTRARAADRLSRMACFSAQDYLARNPDVAAAGFDATFHALIIGANEGRQLFHPDRLARALGHAAGAAYSPAGGLPAGPPPQQIAPVGVFVSSLGNVFMHDIARDIVDGLGAAGVPATLRDETAPAARRPKLCLFVAPHEFFLLGRGRDWIRDEIVADSVMLNTEQPQTPWFACALPFLLAARGVIDLCPQHAPLFAATGLPAMHIAPVPAPTLPRVASGVRHHALFRALPSPAQAPADPATPFVDRALDIAFFGAQTARRDAWMARNAGFLADYETFLYCRRQHRPLRADSPDGALSALASHVCGHARIMLNLHRDAFGFFEWHRIVRLGIASGSVVVSEPCPRHPDLLPGVHYFEAAARQIPDLLEWLLRSTDGQRVAREVQEAAAHALAADITPAATGARLLAFLQHCAS